MIATAPLDVELEEIPDPAFASDLAAPSVIELLLKNQRRLDAILRGLILRGTYTRSDKAEHAANGKGKNPHTPCKFHDFFCPDVPNIFFSAHSLRKCAYECYIENCQWATQL